ncbi:hypothetical protein M413DRAFT_444541 [Hebeloma cylindrosporum]|uniref:Uncharacterized protein n=1 Tax=Hebeloma cylindrosporum TaxID=76867 RepID=A0A0C3CH28_HEBCY|nr:hypothetical protein M413DRAFT_444541 [Hebeloma cylindrosporum h7]
MSSTAQLGHLITLRLRTTQVWVVDLCPLVHMDRRRRRRRRSSSGTKRSSRGDRKPASRINYPDCEQGDMSIDDGACQWTVASKMQNITEVKKNNMGQSDTETTQEFNQRKQ